MKRNERKEYLKMPLFEDETWEVVPQMVANVRRGEPESHVGFLITTTLRDGTEVDMVSELGIAASDRDRVVANLFTASKDMFNAAEKLLPLLAAMELSPVDEEAVATLKAALDGVRESIPSAETRMNR
jgi:hypothetical protein